jgi:hypothetical protein
MLNDPIMPPEEPAASIDLASIDSVALKRLITEVRQQDGDGRFDTTLYNRAYHRHNR